MVHVMSSLNMPNSIQGIPVVVQEMESEVDYVASSYDRSSHKNIEARKRPVRRDTTPYGHPTSATLPSQLPGAYKASSLSGEARLIQIGTRRQRKDSVPKEFRLNEDGINEVHEAVLDKDYDGLLTLVYWSGRHDPSFSLLSLPCCDGRSALHIAVEGQDITAVNILLRGGASILSQDTLGNTVLHTACRQGRVDITYMLIAQPLPCDNLAKVLDSYNHEGWTCFLLAGASGSAPLMRMLISAGCDVSKGDARSGRTLLHHVCNDGNLALAKFLVGELGAGVNPRDFANHTPMGLVNTKRSTDLALFMIQHGAEVKDNDNYTQVVAG